MSKKAEKVNKNGKAKKSGLDVLGIILCIILVPILLVNCTLIVKSYINPAEVPSLGGVMPLIVLTDSMVPNINGGDLIICQKADPETVQIGDIISFFDPAGGSTVITHRVVNINTNNGKLAFITKGDANNAEDPSEVPSANLVGLYRSRIPGLGRVAMFMQTIPGLIVCVGVPLVLLVGFDLIKRKSYEKDQKSEYEKLAAELEALKAQQAAGNAPESTDSADGADK